MRAREGGSATAEQTPVGRSLARSGRWSGVASRVLAAVVAISAVSPAAAQPPPEAPATAPAPTPVPTSLTHHVPRGAVAAFLDLNDRSALAEASFYLDLRRLPKSARQTAGPRLARQLGAVLERGWLGDLDSLSDAAEGDAADDLPKDVDRVGVIQTTAGATPIFVHRVREGGAFLWKFTPDTIANLPTLYAELGYGPIADLLPPFFSETRIGGVFLWQWVGLVGLLPAAYLASALLTVIALRLGAAFARRTRNRIDDLVVARARRPLRWMIAALVFYLGTSYLSLSLRTAAVIATVVLLFVTLEATRLALRLVDVGATVLVARGHTLSPFVPLGRRTLKVLLIAMFGIGALQALGFSITSLLAGLGIGGLAIALASQKTVEHLFGGVTLVADQPVRVGDACRFGDKIGTVEDIGLRSTRIRTIDRTVISIPNGEFSSIQIENFSRRDRTRLHTTLSLGYDTPPDVMRRVLARLESLLVSRAKFDPATVRVRLTNFGTHGYEVELVAYLVTPDADESAAIRHALFLDVVDLLAAEEVEFGVPRDLKDAPNAILTVAERARTARNP